MQNRDGLLNQMDAGAWPTILGVTVDQVGVEERPTRCPPQPKDANRAIWTPPNARPCSPWLGRSWGVLGPARASSQSGHGGRHLDLPTATTVDVQWSPVDQQWSGCRRWCVEA